MGGQVGPDIGVGGAPVRAPVGPQRHVPGQGDSDGVLVGVLVAPLKEVFGQGSVVEPVQGPIFDGAAFDDVSTSARGQVHQILAGVLTLGIQGDSECGPNVFPGQPGALGIGQRAQQTDRLPSVPAEPGFQVLAHRRASLTGKAGAPDRVGGVRQHGPGRLNGGQDSGNKE